MRRVIYVVALFATLILPAQALTAPTLTSPTGGTLTGQRPQFTWNAVAGATWYYLYVQDRTQGGVTTTWVNASTTWTPTSDLNSGSQYRWWAYAWNSAEGSGPWSSSSDFEVGVEGYYVVAPTELDTSGVAWSLSQDRRSHLGTDGAVTFFGTVHLPDGAVVNQVVSYWDDPDPAGDIYIDLSRTSLPPDNAAADVLAVVSSAGSAGLGTTTDTTISSATTDNTAYKYAVEVTFPSSGSATTSRFGGVRIRYISR